MRDWARASPHEYALIYGSPVPGYRAPEQTLTPATRVPAVLGGILSDAWPAAGGTGGGGTGGGGPAAAELPGLVSGQAETVAAVIAPGVPAPVIARALVAWTQLFGLISFELFGQLVGSADPADDFFCYSVGLMADLIGLPEAGA